MQRPTWGLLVFLLLLVLTAGSSPMASAAAVAPVRVGVVLDLSSNVGRERRACISKALHDFDLKHPSYAARVELRVRDSRGDLATATHAAEDLIKNAQVQAIIWGPQTLTQVELVSHLGHRHSHIQIIFISSISPTSCTFWLEDLVTTSGDHPKIVFTLGSDSITFLNLTTDKPNGIKLDRRKTSENCEGRLMKIAVPLKNGFIEFVNTTDPKNITGYSIDIFEAVMGTLDPIPCYGYSVFPGTYDDLVGNVSLGTMYEYDAAVGDVTITAERANGKDFTMPYTQSGVSMLVLAQDEPTTILWTFTKPLSGWLWLATLCGFLYIALVVSMIELPRNQDFQGSWSKKCTTALYFAFSTLTFSHGQSIKSPLSKVVVVIWCFAVLILVQSYTASLSAMLTAKRLRPFVKDLDQLQQSGDYVGYHDGSFVPSVLIKQNISESRLRNYSTKDEYANALRLGSKNGGVSAIVDEIPYLTSFISNQRHQNEFRMLGSIYKTPGFGFAFRQGLSPLVHNLSIAILNLQAGSDGTIIEARWLGTSSPPIGDGTAPDTGSLTLQSFSGLFVITFSSSTLMLLISYIYHACTGPRKTNVESDNLSPEQQPLHETGTDSQVIHETGNDSQVIHETGNDSQAIHVTGESIEEGEPGPVQLGGMHIGSLPATHVQIEMSNV